MPGLAQGNAVEPAAFIWRVSLYRSAGTDDEEGGDYEEDEKADAADAADAASASSGSSSA